MTVAKIVNTHTGKLGIWKLTEPSEKLAGSYSFSAAERNEFNQLKNEKRKKEYLSVRLLLEEMTQEKSTIIYSASGKPRLKNNTPQISISHSPELVVILLSEQNAGVDVENIYRKTASIARRFLSDKELEDTQSMPEPQLSRILYWSAKEAIFKYSPLTEIEFRSHIFIHPFLPEPAGGKFKGELRKERQTNKFTCHYFFYENNVVVYCVEEEKN